MNASREQLRKRAEIRRRLMPVWRELVRGTKLRDFPLFDLIANVWWFHNRAAPTGHEVIDDELQWEQGVELPKWERKLSKRLLEAVVMGDVETLQLTIATVEQLLGPPRMRGWRYATNQSAEKLRLLTYYLQNPHDPPPTKSQLMEWIAKEIPLPIRTEGNPKDAREKMIERFCGDHELPYVKGKKGWQQGRKRK